MRCEVCEHEHGKLRLVPIVKANGKEFIIKLCARCTLWFAGRAPIGCREEVNRA